VREEIHSDRVEKDRRRRVTWTTERDRQADKREKIYTDYDGNRSKYRDKIERYAKSNSKREKEVVEKEREKERQTFDKCESY